MMESREKLTDRRRIKRSRMQLILNSSSSQNSKFSWMDECTTTSRRGFPSHGKPRWNQNMCLFHMFWCFHTEAEAEVGERGSLWSESEKEGSVMSCGDGRNSARAVVPVSSSACKQMHMVHKVCIDCAGTGLIRNELSCHTYPISRLTDFLSLTSW